MIKTYDQMIPITVDEVFGIRIVKGLRSTIDSDEKTPGTNELWFCFYMKNRRNKIDFVFILSFGKR